MNAEPELLILYLITTYLQLFFFLFVWFFFGFFCFVLFFFQKLFNEQILSLKYELITSISWTNISVQLLH